MNFQLLSNVVNTARLVSSNVADDPSYFALQVARKFKNHRLTNILDKILSAGNSSELAAAFSAMMRDDTTALHLASESWLHKPQGSRGAVFLANLCIASGDWEMASKLLNRASSSTAAVRARARLQWALGNMSDAVRVLSGIKPNRQKRHYESEIAVYQGAEPHLEAASVKSDDSTALFLATNSLPHTGSGYAQRTQSMLAALCANGWTVRAATRVNYPLNIGHLRARTKDVVGPVEYERLLPFPAKHDLSGRIHQQSEELLSKVLRERPAILHTTTDFTNALAVKAVSAATGIPWVYEVRGQLADTWLSTRPGSAVESERYKLFTEREAFVAKSADYVLTLGEEMKSNLINVGVDPGRIAILPNGVGEDYLDEPVARRNAREKLHLDPAAFYIGTVSSLVSYEGLDTVLRAAALLRHKHNNLRVLIVGDGVDMENLRSLVTELGIAEICQFTGRVPRERAHLYHCALNAFVVPRRDLSVTRSVTPLKPVEALASGVPVLASDLPALRELIIDGENGHLIPAGEPQAWATAIARLLSDPDMAERMGRKGRAQVLKTRTWKANAQRLSEIYERIINQGA